MIHFAEFEVNPRAGELRRRGIKIKLQEQPFQVLAMLLERPGDVVTRDELQQRIWHGDAFVDFENGLNKAINKLRGALRDSAETPRFIETLPRRGYRFIGSIERDADLWHGYVRKREPMPAHLTSFVGRKREIREIARLLRSTTRLVTLTGPGGVGKSRLALQAAAKVESDFPEGVSLVELASLSDPALVAKAVASAVDVPEPPDRPLTDALATALHRRRLLLVLDNCEHLLSACRDLTRALLRACPTLRVLATSRQCLGVEGEALYRVPPLGLPDLNRLPPLASLADCDSVRLFVERAALSQSTFALTASTAPAVAQICHRVDGIPLAIEFAAARVRVLSVEQIASRLDDRFGLLRSGAAGAVPRHQTLRAATDWSYALLSEPERTVLRRCSVFAGGWTVDAAEDVCSGGAVERVEVLELFSSLIDKSLITANMRDREARYRLLETIRQYGSERLEESGEVDSVRSRHQAWCLALAEEAAPELWGPRQALWLARLEREHDNLRAALEWSLAEANGSEAALRLSGALHIFWIRHGHWREGRDWTDRALARIDGRPTPAVLMALHGATNLALKQSDYSCARAHGEMGLRRSRESGNEEMAAWFLFRLAQVASKQEDYDRATALLAESLDLSHDRALASLAPGLFGSIAWRRGDYDGAVAWLTKGLELLKEAGDIWHVATAYSELGYLARLQGDHARAVAFYKQGLALCRTLGDRWTTQECLVGLAFVACANHEYERAAQLFAVSEASYEDLRWERSAVFQATVDQEIAHARWGLGEKAFACAWAAGRAMTLEQAIEYGLGTERQRIGPQA